MAMPESDTASAGPVPREMLAAKKTAAGRAALVRVDMPGISPDGVLLRVRACAICASDLPEWDAPVAGPGHTGEWDADNPGLTGHEVAGDIVAVGDRVDPSRVGEAVWVDPIAGCGQCEWCRDGRQTFCESVSIVCQGFAEYMAAPARQCRPIPERWDYATASMISDMAGTPFSAVKRAGVAPGESVAVWGLGPVGLGLVQASLAAGAGRVTGLDPVAERRARANAIGAATVDPTVSDCLSRLRELTGAKGPDVVLCSVRSDRGSKQAFDALRPDGRMVTVAGNPPAGGEERKWVSGSWGCDERDWPDVLEHLRSRKFVLDDYVTHVFPLSQIEQGFATRAGDLEGSFKVVITND
jgi:threonine dehydrogenase-like Zn-dependent dehydrogenase